MTHPGTPTLNSRPGRASRPPAPSRHDAPRGYFFAMLVSSKSWRYPAELIIAACATLNWQPLEARCYQNALACSRCSRLFQSRSAHPRLHERRGHRTGLRHRGPFVRLRAGDDGRMPGGARPVHRPHRLSCGGRAAAIRGHRDDARRPRTLGCRAPVSDAGGAGHAGDSPGWLQVLLRTHGEPHADQHRAPTSTRWDHCATSSTARTH